MKAAVQDAATLRAVKPLEMVAYLRSRGWLKEAVPDTRGSVWLWTNKDGEEFDVMLPMKRDFADYALRMGETLRTLAEAEQRSQLDILRDVQTISADIVRVRAPRQDVESGSLPLDAAVKFVARSREMILAAACATIEKRAFYAKRKALQAIDYLETVRMGQTEQGSFVLTFLSPVTPELKPNQTDLLSGEPSEPFGRQVTRTLAESLGALDEAARQSALAGGNLRPFQDAVVRGVSANLCDAVVGLSSVSPLDGVDIQISWSRTRPVSAQAPTRVKFEVDSIPIIEEAGRVFRELAPIDDFEVVGFVTRLNREQTEKEGDVTIAGDVDGKPRKIVVALDEQMYGLAVRAHDNRLLVTCVGELVKEGRSHRLRNPRGFQVVSIDDLLE